VGKPGRGDGICLSERREDIQFEEQASSNYERGGKTSLTYRDNPQPREQNIGVKKGGTVKGNLSGGNGSGDSLQEGTGTLKSKPPLEGPTIGFRQGALRGKRALADKPARFLSKKGRKSKRELH